MSLGNMAGPLLSGILADMFSLRPIFYMGSGISFIGLALYLILLPRGISPTAEPIETRARAPHPS